MIIVPAVDVKEGVVVQAVRGERDRYGPIQSVICDSAEPVSVVKAFRNLGFDTIYVADLDSIMRGRLNYRLYEELSRADVNIMLDAGTQRREEIKEVLRRGIGRVVVGTESTSNLAALSEVFGELDQRLALSLDLKDGKVVSLEPLLSGRSISEALRHLSGLPISTYLLVDLSKVGTLSGFDFSKAEELRRCLGGGRALIVGGGIEGLNDLLRLKRAGVDGALISSCLHKGRLKIGDLKSARLL